MLQVARTLLEMGRRKATFYKGVRNTFSLRPKGLLFGRVSRSAVKMDHSDDPSLVLSEGDHLRVSSEGILDWRLSSWKPGIHYWGNK